MINIIFFTADLHLGHENILRHCHRPFASVDEMDAMLIKNWNETVNTNDSIYILGDFTMRNSEAAHNYLTALNGRKYFVSGNHDRFLKRIDYFGKHFEWIKDYFVLKYNGRSFILFHYPLAEWASYFRGAIHLHGHVHSSLNAAAQYKDSALAFNVGVDCHNYRPVSIEKVLAMADAKRSNRRPVHELETPTC